MNLVWALLFSFCYIILIFSSAEKGVKLAFHRNLSNKRMFGSFMSTKCTWDTVTTQYKQRLQRLPSPSVRRAANFRSSSNHVKRAERRASGAKTELLEWSQSQLFAWRLVRGGRCLSVSAEKNQVSPQKHSRLHSSSDCSHMGTEKTWCSSMFFTSSFCVTQRNLLRSGRLNEGRPLLATGYARSSVNLNLAFWPFA